MAAIQLRSETTECLILSLHKQSREIYLQTSNRVRVVAVCAFSDFFKANRWICRGELSWHQHVYSAVAGNWQLLPGEIGLKGGTAPQTTLHFALGTMRLPRLPIGCIGTDLSVKTLLSELQWNSEKCKTSWKWGTIPLKGKLVSYLCNQVFKKWNLFTTAWSVIYYLFINNFHFNFPSYLYSARKKSPATQDSERDTHREAWGEADRIKYMLWKSQRLLITHDWMQGVY